MKLCVRSSSPRSRCVDGARSRQATVAPTNDLPNPFGRARIFPAAAGPHVGIDERRRHRQGRQVDLGRRALRAEQLRNPATGEMSPLDPC